MIISSSLAGRILVASAFLTLVSNATPPLPPEGKRWVLNEKFSDEFNGTELDKSKWHDHHPKWRGRPPGIFLPSQVSVGGGYELVDADLTPGETFHMEFPELGPTWKNAPAKAGVYLPKDYTADRKFPLLVWFGGGAGTDDPKKAVAITEGKGFICVAVPYGAEDDGNKGGWQTPWAFYQTIFDRLESVVPNIDPDRRVCGGFSSGGAAIMYLIGNSEEACQEYFHAFMPGGAGWPMGGLASIKGRPMLAIMGAKDKRLPNYRILEKEALAAGVDFELFQLQDVGHGMPPEFYPKMREWLAKKVIRRNNPGKISAGDSKTR